MSITDKNIIDALGTDKSTDEVILTITDHLRWDDVQMHLQSLQDKLNTYIEFIEGEQIYESYPNVRGRLIVVEIVSQQDYSREGKDFLQRATPVVHSIGAELRQRVFKG